MEEMRLHFILKAKTVYEAEDISVGCQQFGLQALPTIF